MGMQRESFLPRGAVQPALEQGTGEGHRAAVIKCILRGCHKAANVAFIAGSLTQDDSN